jgi:heme-degrading monooxygenase HmoA
MSLWKGATNMQKRGSMKVGIKRIMKRMKGINKMEGMKRMEIMRPDDEYNANTFWALRYDD